jgi:hypothetical protein
MDAVTDAPRVKLIKIEDAAELVGCDVSVINSLVKESRSNGFPSARFGPRTIRIDENRLIDWIINGGLDGVNS